MRWGNRRLWHRHFYSWFILLRRSRLFRIFALRGAVRMAISDGDRHEAYLRRAQPPVLDVEGMLVVLRRRAVFIAAVTLACAALSLVYVLLAAPKYAASGRVSLGGAVAVTNEAANASVIENQIKAITSRDVLSKVIARERLETDPPVRRNNREEFSLQC